MEADLLYHIQKLKLGDEDAFREIYILFHGRIAAFCLGHQMSQEDAKEVVQETFIKLWESRSAIESDKNFEGYIYRIAKNLIIDRFRRITREKAARSYQIYMLGTENSTENKILHDELEVQIQATIESLPKIRRLVFHMSRVRGLSNREIAKELNISIRTVETHISKALQSFYEEFGQSRAI